MPQPAKPCGVKDKNIQDYGKWNVPWSNSKDKFNEHSLKIKPSIHSYQPSLPGHTGSGSILQACNKGSKTRKQERVEDKISIYFLLSWVIKYFHMPHSKWNTVSNSFSSDGGILWWCHLWLKLFMRLGHIILLSCVDSFMPNMAWVAGTHFLPYKAVGFPSAIFNCLFSWNM